MKEDVKAYKFIKALKKKDNVKAGRYLEQILKEKCQKKIAKVLGK